MPTKPKDKKRPPLSPETKKVFEDAVVIMQDLKKVDEAGRKSRLIVDQKPCSCDRCPRGGKCGKH